MVDHAHRCVKNLGHFTVKITAKSIFFSSKTRAYIACTERNKETIQWFEDGMKKVNAKFSVIARGTYNPTEALLCSDVLHQPTRIYLVTLSENLL